MPHASIKVDQTIQVWGNGLALRITAPIAKAANLAQGVPVTVETGDGCLIIRPVGKPKLSLAQKLKLFDAATHGGEFEPSGRIGAEVF